MNELNELNELRKEIERSGHVAIMNFAFRLMVYEIYFDPEVLAQYYQYWGGMVLNMGIN